MHLLATLTTPTPWHHRSMAAPHVSGTAIGCFAAGECSLKRGRQNREIFLRAMWRKFNSDKAYRWSPDNIWGAKYYGPMVWAAQW